MRSLTFALLASAVGLSAAPALAAPVVVTNASFESPTQAPGTYEDGNGVITGWSKLGTQQGDAQAGVQNFGDPSYFTPADGSQVVYINRGTLFQNIGTLLANTTYTLTVAAGNQPNYGRDSTGSFGFYSDTGQEYSSTVAVPLRVGSMTDFSTTFTTGGTVSGGLVIALSLRSNDQVLYDNVRVDATPLAGAAVPEPATWGMMVLGFGLVGAGLRGRANRRTTVRFA